MKGPLRGAAWWLFSAAALITTGCASSGFGEPISGSDHLSPQERRLQGVENKLVELSRRLDTVNLTGMDRDYQNLASDMRQLRGEIERLRHELDQSQQRGKQQYLDMDRRLQSLEAAAAPAYGIPAYGAPSFGSPAAGTGDAAGAQFPVPRQTPDGPPPAAPSYQSSGVATPVTITSGSGASPEEESAYLNAFDALKSGKYDDAINGFKTVLSRWPRGRYADNALYWSGEAYYVKRDYANARQAFDGVLKQFTDSPKVPDALLKLGLTQIELKQTAEGQATLQSLVQQYPQSSAARLAQQRLGGN